MNFINKCLFIVNSVLILILTLIGIYASKNYSISIIQEIIQPLLAIKEELL